MPVVGLRFRNMRVDAACVLVPKAPSNLNYFHQPWKDQIRLTRQRGDVKSKAIPQRMNSAANSDLGLSVFTPDETHVLATLTF